MKVVPRQLLRSSRATETINRPLLRIPLVGSAFVASVIYSFKTSSEYYFVAPWLSGGMLFGHLQRTGRTFSEQTTRFYATELLCALKSYHAQGIVLGNLKPEICLLDANGHLTLSNFGLLNRHQADPSMEKKTKGTDHGLSPKDIEYAAPEVLMGDHYDTTADYWSLGVLLFEMAFGWSPFYAETTEQMYKNVTVGNIRFPRDALSPAGKRFLKGLMNRNPEHRIGADNGVEDLMMHPWFNGIDWEKTNKKLVDAPICPWPNAASLDPGNLVANEKRFGWRTSNERLSASLPSSRWYEY